MPTIRIERPGKRGTSPFEAAGAFAAFAAAPVASTLSTFGRAIQERSTPEDQKDLFWLNFEADTETGKVTVFPDRGRVGAVYNRTIPSVQAALERAWATGDTAGVPRAYRSAAAALLAQKPKPQEAPNMPGIIPPGGFAGFAQMTPASKLGLSGGFARSSKRSRKSKSGRKYASRIARAAVKRTRRKAKRKGKKLVKGSAAARRFMAKLRGMRKR